MVYTCTWVRIALHDLIDSNSILRVGLQLHSLTGHVAMQSGWTRLQQHQNLLLPRCLVLRLEMNTFVVNTESLNAGDMNWVLNIWSFMHVIQNFHKNHVQLTSDASNNASNNACKQGTWQGSRVGQSYGLQLHSLTGHVVGQSSWTRGRRIGLLLSRFEHSWKTLVYLQNQINWKINLGYSI